MAETTTYIVERADGSKRRVIVPADTEVQIDLTPYEVRNGNGGSVIWYRYDRNERTTIAGIGNVVAVYVYGEIVIESIPAGE